MFTWYSLVLIWFLHSLDCTNGELENGVFFNLRFPLPELFEMFIHPHLTLTEVFKKFMVSNHFAGWQYCLSSEVKENIATDHKLRLHSYAVCGWRYSQYNQWWKQHTGKFFFSSNMKKWHKSLKLADFLCRVWMNFLSTYYFSMLYIIVESHRPSTLGPECSN